jgi:hypothetical protein
VRVVDQASPDNAAVAKTKEGKGHSMKIVGICPTFRQPTLVANVLACWLAQDYPAADRHLLICDDAGTFSNQEGDGWSLISADNRFSSLPAKYNFLQSIARQRYTPDALAVIESDDIYLPGYVSAVATQLEQHELCKPSHVLSDYTGRIEQEFAHGRFHSTLAFRRELIERVGGWPETPRADFDQQLMSKLFGAVKSVGDPGVGQFVYSWHTGAAHCQSTMRSPDDESWYDRGEEAYAKVPFVGKLEPKFDLRTERIFQQLGVALPCVVS